MVKMAALSASGNDIVRRKLALLLLRGHFNLKWQFLAIDPMN